MNQLFEEIIPFGLAFKVVWSEWISYRKQSRYKNYTEMGIKKTFTKLKNLSNNEEDTAIQMLERAMENNWQGFNFKLPENGHKIINRFDQPGTSEARINAASNW